MAETSYITEQAITEFWRDFGGRPVIEETQRQTPVKQIDLVKTPGYQRSLIGTKIRQRKKTILRLAAGEALNTSRSIPEIKAEIEILKIEYDSIKLKRPTKRSRKNAESL